MQQNDAPMFVKASFAFGFSVARSGNLLECWVRTRQGWATPGMEGEVGLRARFGVAAVRFPQAPSRTRRAPFRAPGAPRVFPAGQPPTAASGFGVQGVGMLLPR